jgi:hypothetical protein
MSIFDAAFYIEAEAGGSVTVTPGTAHLILTPYAPSLPSIVTPGVAHLVLTPHAPALTSDVAVVPGVAHLVLTPHAPSVLAAVSPGVAHLVLTPHTPSVFFGVSVAPDVAHLVLTPHAPSLSFGVFPGVAHLILTPHAPLFGAVFTPGVAHLVLTPHAPGAVNFTPFGVITREHDVLKDAPTTAYYLEAIIATNGDVVRCHLVNVTDGTIIPGSEVTSASATPDRQRSAAITLAGDKVYRADFGGISGNTYKCYAADVIADVSS